MVCAQEAYWQLGLDGVVLMPLGRPSHRSIDNDPGPEERYRLCEAAAQGVDWLTVSRVEVDRPGETFTVDTLEQLRTADPDAEYVFVLGADQAMRLESWHEPARVLELAPLAVAERAGVPLDALRDIVARLGGEDRLTPFSMPRDGRVLDRRARACRRGPALPVPGAGARGRADRAGGPLPVTAEAKTAPSEALARRIASVALDKKARDVVVLDMRDVVSYTDFLVIATGNTERQTHAIEDAVYQDLKHTDEGDGRIPGRVEGRSEGRWILMDYFDAVVHIFTPAARDYYRLETLWGEVPELEVERRPNRPDPSVMRTSVRITMEGDNLDAEPQGSSCGGHASLPKRRGLGLDVYRPVVEGCRADLIFGMPGASDSRAVQMGRSDGQRRQGDRFERVDTRPTATFRRNMRRTRSIAVAAYCRRSRTSVTCFADLRLSRVETAIYLRLITDPELPDGSDKMGREFHLRWGYTPTTGLPIATDGVELRGLEPLASAMPCRRSPN